MNTHHILENETLTEKNSTLVLVDYQPAIISAIASGDKKTVTNVAICAAKSARIFGVPVVLSSIGPKRNGEFIPEITRLFPGQEVFTRRAPGPDAFDDEQTLYAVRKTGRKKVVLAGIWTSGCFAGTAFRGLKEGFVIYGLMDATGDATKSVHENSIDRMIKAGVIPITLGSLIEKWTHDLGKPEQEELKRTITPDMFPRTGSKISNTVL